MACLGAKALPGVDLLFGDTGYHFVETLGLRDAVQAIYPVNVRSLKPELTIAEQDHRYGEDLWARDPDKCCAMRKTAPMDAALRSYDAWATGLRRSDHVGRARDAAVPLGRASRHDQDQPDCGVHRGTHRGVHPRSTGSWRTRSSRSATARSAARPAPERSSTARTSGPDDGAGARRWNAGCICERLPPVPRPERAAGPGRGSRPRGHATHPVVDRGRGCRGRGGARGHSGRRPMGGPRRIGAGRRAVSWTRTSPARGWYTPPPATPRSMAPSLRRPSLSGSGRCALRTPPAPRHGPRPPPAPTA